MKRISQLALPAVEPRATVQRHWRKEAKHSNINIEVKILSTQDDIVLYVIINGLNS